LTEAAKEIFIIGGPNGAGKTTAATVLLPRFIRVQKYLNADEIAREIAPEAPDSAAFAAGRAMIERMREFVRIQQSFAFETTCSGKTYLPLLERCKSTGWRIVVIYFWLSTPEDAIARSSPGKQGWTRYPEGWIRRRYYSGIRNMLSLYLPLADEAEIYDNADAGRILIAEKRMSNGLLVRDLDRWSSLKEASAWNA